MVHRGLYCKSLCRKTQEKVTRTEEEVWNGELLVLMTAYIGSWKRLTREKQMKNWVMDNGRALILSPLLTISLSLET